jgi:glutamate 5-kinase
MTRLGWSQRPTAIHQLQAAAAVGQMGLVQTYEAAFQNYGLQTAQVLLDHDDLSSRQRYLNARSTLKTLVELGVVPVVNENDTVVTDEICFGDNDTLAGLVANLINADILAILTDQQGLYDADPADNPDARLIPQAQANDEQLLKAAGTGHGVLGSGGMLTKIKAARLAARSGTATVIAHGGAEDILLRLQRGEPEGSLLLSDQQPLAARKQWLASHLQVRGRLILDAGAVDVLRKSGRSLLPVGVKSVWGHFMRGDMVACEDENGTVVARGLINYNYEEAQKIIGQPSERIADLLGYDGDHELIHRDNMAVL